MRFWNQVDEDGSSFWVFEHRNVRLSLASRSKALAAHARETDQPDQPANVVDAKMFWIAMYAYPAAWILLLFVGLLKFNISFMPIVLLALVFNVTNTIGYTYADRDAKKRWATGIAASGMLGQIGGLGGSVVSGLAQSAMGKVFGGR